MVILKIGRTRHVHYIKEWVYMFPSEDLGHNIFEFSVVGFFFTCFLLDFQNLGIHATMAHLKYLCQLFLICSASTTLVDAFWSVFSFMRSSGSYFWRWMQWAVLTCVMQFHDQFEIIIPLINSWISLFVSAILEFCLGWMWKPLHHLQVNANSIYFYRSLVNVTSNKGTYSQILLKNPHTNKDVYL